MFPEQEYLYCAGLCVQPSTCLVHGAADAVGVAEEVGLTSVGVGVAEVVVVGVGVAVKTGSVVHGSEFFGAISETLQVVPLYV